MTVFRKARPGEYCVVSTGRGTYAIVAPDGAVISSGWGDQLQAIDRMERIRAQAGQRIRPCITCGETFRSEGSHNRMCNPCRAHAADDYGRLDAASMPRLTLGRARA